MHLRLPCAGIPSVFHLPLSRPTMLYPDFDFPDFRSIRKSTKFQHACMVEGGGGC